MGAAISNARSKPFKSTPRAKTLCNLFFVQRAVGEGGGEGGVNGHLIQAVHEFLGLGVSVSLRLVDTMGKKYMILSGWGRSVTAHLQIKGW
jgi:hypothetical protein